jgi:voltage-dependent calcium channel T type alpha-1I
MVQALEVINYIFTSIFLAEALVKLLAWGVKQYFNDEWNIFDFFVALGSLIGVILQMFDLKFGIKGVATVLRSFRVFRLVRLLRRGGRNLYMIFNTFVITITSLSNIGALLLLIIFMYSVLGMILLGHVKRNGLMNAYMNFENFWNAFITLFTVTTGDSWNATQTSFVLWPSPNNECIWHPTY